MISSVCLEACGDSSHVSPIQPNPQVLKRWLPYMALYCTVRRGSRECDLNVSTISAMKYASISSGDFVNILFIDTFIKKEASCSKSTLNLERRPSPVTAIDSFITVSKTMGPRLAPTPLVTGMGRMTKTVQHQVVQAIITAAWL